MSSSGWNDFWQSGQSSLVGDHESPEVVRQASLEAAHGLVACLALHPDAGRTQRSIPAALLAVIATSAPPGTRSRSTVWSRFATRTRCAARFARRSSSSANTVVWSSGATAVASPCRAATLAAAAASITSVLRRLPRESSRTRAVAVLGTSTTASPRATSHWARCRPKPRAPSTAHRRSSNC